ncbi:hypothetical protein BDL97_17G100100 [Sphagnum fallax]|nr:hypothetical protein BDL97_17G100100 [Sphagnum fallax]
MRNLLRRCTPHFLQQWMEYCPRGRKPTCPICKQECSSRDVHRLFFQSVSADPTQQPQSPLQTSKSGPVTDNPLQDLSPAVQKLEGQLAVTKSALLAHQEQLKDLNSQAVLKLQRAERAEAALVVVKREWRQSKENLSRVQEELHHCAVECNRLQQENLAMARDLAAHKLVTDTDLGEEDVLRLASAGGGSNKSAIIDTLTKSLILRNKSYKELMARCNELGLGESRAMRKSEKTLEQLKRMKARVHELEIALEEKENADLRVLSKRSLKPHHEAAHSPQNILNSHQEWQVPISSPAVLPTELSSLSRGQIVNIRQGSVQLGAFKPSSLHDGSSRSMNSSDLVGFTKTGLQEFPNWCMEKEQGQLSLQQTLQSCSHRVDNQVDNSGLPEVAAKDVRNKLARSECSRVQAPKQRLDSCDKDIDKKAAGNIGISWTLKSQSLFLKIEALNRSMHSSNQAVTHSGTQKMLSGADQAETSPCGRQETVLLEGTSPPFVSSSQDGQEPTTSHPETRENLSLEFVTWSSPSTVSGTQHKDNEGVGSPLLALTQRANDSGAFRKRAASGKENSVQSGSFILSGADGRGGRVTILKPPSLSLGMTGISTSKRVKRPKVSGAVNVNRQGALQIEHFFGRVPC